MAVASPVAALGISPTAVTVSGVVLAGAATASAGPQTRWALLSAVLVALSGIADGIDGAVAVLRDRVSRRGALADAIADRLGDAAYAAVLWRLGAPAWLALLWVGLAGLAEYVRARTEGLLAGPFDVVTVGERPTRILVAVFTALGCGVVPSWSDGVASVGAGVGVLAALAGLAHLGRQSWRRLA
jgi:CDP-diacylglycerol--glycerol-3-phosphate 3-phosphatidyltransferase